LTMRANIPRRMFLQLAAPTLLPWLSRAAHAQSFPNRFVRLIVPFPPGGGGDALARPLAQRLSEVWGQQIIVESRGGAGGNVGAYQAANAPPDGYTLLLGAAYLSINPALYPASGYSPFTDLAPISLLTVIPNIMMVSNSSPAHSVREFIDYARANQGSVTFVSTGIGSSPHLSGELFKRMAGIEMTHVPYRGAGPAMNDLLPGRVSVMFSNLPGVMPQVQSKTVRGLGITAAKRIAAAPDIPTIGETVPGYEVATWWGMFAPARTPADVIEKIRADTVAALGHESVKSRYEALGAPPSPSTPAELAALLRADAEKWAPIVKDAGIKPE